jgi:hypothetical protein
MKTLHANCSLPRCQHLDSPLKVLITTQLGQCDGVPVASLVQLVHCQRLPLLLLRVDVIGIFGLLFLGAFLFKKIGLRQTCSTIKKKSRSHLKILARIVTQSKFLPDDLWIFDANTQNLVDTATWCHRICASLVYGVNTSACSTLITFQTLCGHSWHWQFTGLSIIPLKPN